jgi:hypothetical protein
MGDEWEPFLAYNDQHPITAQDCIDRYKNFKKCFAAKEYKVMQNRGGNLRPEAFIERMRQLASTTPPSVPTRADLKGFEEGLFRVRFLIIHKEWLDKIFNTDQREETQKVFEMRSRGTEIRGRIGLIEGKKKGGSGLVVGFVDLTDCLKDLTLGLLQDTEVAKLTGIKPALVRDVCFPEGKKKPGDKAWVFANATRLLKPQPRTVRPGQVIWATHSTTCPPEGVALIYQNFLSEEDVQKSKEQARKVVELALLYQACLKGDSAGVTRAVGARWQVARGEQRRVLSALDLDELISEDLTPCHIVCALAEDSSGAHCLSILLEAGANPNVESPVDFYTPCMKAAEAGNLKCLGVLKRYADSSREREVHLYNTTNDGLSALDLANKADHKDVVLYLRYVMDAKLGIEVLSQEDEERIATYVQDHYTHPRATASEMYTDEYVISEDIARLYDKRPTKRDIDKVTVKARIQAIARFDQGGAPAGAGAGAGASYAHRTQLSVVY